MNFLTLENEQLTDIYGGGGIGDIYKDVKDIYKDVRKNWDNMQDFANGFIDGISGN